MPRFALLISAVLASIACSTAPLAQTPSHHTNRGFTNPHAEHAHSGFFGIIRARFGGNWQSYDRERDIVPATEPAPATTDEFANATVTWIGHSTVLLQHRGVNVLTDPMFSKYASPVSFAGPSRITQPALKFEDLPAIHAVIISHDHYDHLDTASIRALGDEPLYFVPLGVGEWFLNKGINPERVVELDWWQDQSMEVAGEQITITATPAQHFSGRSLTNRDSTLWASWAVAWSDFNAWFGGDTGYNELQFKEIGTRLGPFDLGIIPIGAYEPRWFMGTVHVNPEEAVLIHQEINARQSFGIHWGTFVLAGEGVLTPPAALAKARKAKDLPESEFSTYAVGETRHYTPQQPSVSATR